MHHNDTILCSTCGHIMVSRQPAGLECMNCGEQIVPPSPPPSVGRIVHYWPNEVERFAWRKEITTDVFVPRLEEPYVGRIVSVCPDPSPIDPGRIVMVVDLPPHVEYVVACYSPKKKPNHWTWPERVT